MGFGLGFGDLENGRLGNFMKGDGGGMRFFFFLGFLEEMGGRLLVKSLGKVKGLDRVL